MDMKDKKLKEQFNLRAKEFDISANWVSDKNLIQTHVKLAGEPCGEALDLCCGTGQLGRALKKRGWSVKGLDMAENMVKISSAFFPVVKKQAKDMPFNSNSCQLVVCRQSFQFLDIEKVLSEVARILAPKGTFILSLTIPFSNLDKSWLYKIHKTKQPLLLKFYTAEGLITELKQAGFLVKKTITLTVRESINKWMSRAPELRQQLKDEVISMVRDAPCAYKKLHKVSVVGGEIFEDWNWIVLKATFSKT